MDSAEKHVERLKLVTPLSLLILIAASLLGSLVVRPTVAQISDGYQTVMTPSSAFIGLYWAVLAVLLIGTSILVPLARRDDTKKAIAYGLGLRLALILLIMAGWVLCWALRAFVASEILLLINLVLALSMWGMLLRFPPAPRPFDYLFIGAPVRMLLAVLLHLDVWQNGLLALGWYTFAGADGDDPLGGGKGTHGTYTWIVFGAVLGAAVLGAIVIFATTDLVWAASSMYLSIVTATTGAPDKPAHVIVALILAATLSGLALVASVAWRLINQGREQERGNIRLPDDDDSDSVADDQVAAQSSIRAGGGHDEV